LNPVAGCFQIQKTKKRPGQALAGTIQLPSACNEQIAPIYVSERGIYAASTPNHPVTSKNSIGIAFGTVKRHKCRAPAASHLNRSGLVMTSFSIGRHSSLPIEVD
jgi:hypothetical protein